MFLNRRTFITSILSGISFISGWRIWKTYSTPRTIKTVISGASHKTGHLLRDSKIMSQAVEHITKKIVIVGGGVAGLSALRTLNKAGITDILLLEHENLIGGNAAYHENKISKYPLGAHYLPIPDLNFLELKSFLEEHKVITGYDKNQKPIYNEEYLCFEPEERLYIHGHWQEGLIPHFGVPENEKQEIKRFLDLMHSFSILKGNDGLDAFSIPLCYSSKDLDLQKLDTISMSEFLKDHNFSSRYLIWYVDYCCQDDFGTTLIETSAWAGIHYFAARKGAAANASSNDVLTWPEGNGFLIDLLKKNNTQYVETNKLVYHVKSNQNGVIVNYIDTKTEKLFSIQASKVIMCTPQFINQHILQEKIDFDYSKFTYAPWVVASITIEKFGEKKGAGMSWDNVIFEGSSLGYINATHQQLVSHQNKLVLSLYMTFSNLDAKEARKMLLKRTSSEWQTEVITILKKAHKNIESSILDIDIWIWGHAMIKPTVGFITGNDRELAQKPIGNIHFAHSDLSGMSIFEEAFYHGNRVAKEVLM